MVIILVLFNYEHSLTIQLSLAIFILKDIRFLLSDFSSFQQAGL